MTDLVSYHSMRIEELENLSTKIFKFFLNLGNMNHKFQ